MQFLTPAAEKILIGALTAFFLIGFIGRNLLLKKKTGKRVRGSGTAAAITQTTLMFTLANLSVLSERVYTLLLPVTPLRSHAPAIAGYLLFFAATICCILFSRQLRDSWRVGIVEHDATELVTSGVYRFVRNPYFLAYFALFVALTLIRPSVVLLLLTVLTIYVYHRMVMREEAYLEQVHGDAYRAYTSRSGRYLPFVSAGTDNRAGNTGEAEKSERRG